MCAKIFDIEENMRGVAIVRRSSVRLNNEMDCLRKGRHDLMSISDFTPAIRVLRVVRSWG